MRIYIAGPMRSKPDYNFPAFDAAAENLRRQGHVVISPAEHDRAMGFNGIDLLPDPVNVAALFQWDLAQVCTVDAVVVLPGWEWSVGASLEVGVAHYLGKLVREYSMTGK